MSRLVNGSSIWVSVVVILLYAALCVVSTTFYAFQQAPPPRARLIIAITWAVANTLGCLLLAMTLYGWAQLILFRRRRQTSLTGSIVSGEKTVARQLANAASHLDATPAAQHGAQSTALGGVRSAEAGQSATATQPATGLRSALRAGGGGAARGGGASILARTTLVVASAVLVATAVAPQNALNILNQPRPTHRVEVGNVVALAQAIISPSAAPSPSPAPSTTPVAAIDPASLHLPVMKSVFLSTGRRCGDVATNIAWTLTNTATTQAGKPAASAVNWVAYVGDPRFSVSPGSGKLAPKQTITVRVRGPAMPSGNGLYLSLYVTDSALDSIDITDAVTCVTQ